MVPFNEEQVRAILLDIEGTTTPVDFVYKTLFPYASRKLESFLRENSGNPEIQKLVADLRGQQESDSRSGLKPPAWRDDPEPERLCSCVAYGLWLIQRDSKCTPLKLLQGKIWQQGYESGELHGEVYPDVPVAFERWKRQNRVICIYSSGSTLAQQLLFRTTRFGDLTKCILQYFDTRVGAKTEPESYRRIAKALAYLPQQILFLSDAVREIEAARGAGMAVLLCERQGHPGSQLVSEAPIHDFTQVFPD